jgi:hypothetical protein
MKESLLVKMSSRRNETLDFHRDTHWNSPPATIEDSKTPSKDQGTKWQTTTRDKLHARRPGMVARDEIFPKDLERSYCNILQYRYACFFVDGAWSR